LAAPDTEKLCSWLRRQPLLHREGNWLIVHAGLWPDWSAEEADRTAAEVSAELDGPDSAQLLAAYSQKVLVPWRANLEGTERLSTAAIILTLMRTVSVEGSPDVDFTGPIEAVPDGSHPWFEAPSAAQADGVVIFGHWARLGYYRNTRVICLDSGCVHGGLLTALCIDTGEVFQEPVAESDVVRRQASG
jgi:bis(5'-nucleosyl)-tetraphosphatase (symmetrical)